MTQGTLSSLLLEAARAMEGVGTVDANVLGLLADLRYRPRSEGGGANSHEASLLRAAAGLDRLFELRCPFSPGLRFFGAEVRSPDHRCGAPRARTAPASGAGPTLREAFECCVGEAVEFLSQFEPSAGAAIVRTGPADAFAEDRLGWGVPEGAEPSAWVQATWLDGGGGVLLPADLCYRERADNDFEPAWKLGSGCAAANTREAATLRGLQELIERDAVSHWWASGRRARAVGLDDAVASAEFLRRARREAASRRAWLLDITTETSVPCVAALSCDDTGRGLAYGTACRESLSAAALAATKEMCQSELAGFLVILKREERGEAALNEGDREHAARNQLDAASMDILMPAGPPVSREPVGDLGALVSGLAKRGVRPCVVDLTQPGFDVPVMRVVAPGLRPWPCSGAGDAVGRPGIVPDRPGPVSGECA